MTLEEVDVWVELAVRLVGVAALGFGVAWCIASAAEWLWYGVYVNRRTAMAGELNRLQRVLRWLRVVDESGNLSLTNLTLYGSLINLYFGAGTAEALASAGETAWALLQQLGPLALALFNYGHKRTVLAKAEALNGAHLAKLTASLDALDRTRRASGSAQPSA